VYASTQSIRRRFIEIFRDSQENQSDGVEDRPINVIQKSIDERFIQFTSVAKSSGLSLKEIELLPVYDYYILLENLIIQSKKSKGGTK